jgi:hypothetical protein
LWEPKIATLVNVHEHGRTLALVAVGCNRIGKETWCDCSPPFALAYRAKVGHPPLFGGNSSVSN